MPIPAQTPNLVNKDWIVFIKDSAFNSLYDVYLRNFDVGDRQRKEYSVLWFRQMWSKLNDLARINHPLTISIEDIENAYNPSRPLYGKLQFETKIIYSRNDGQYYHILVVDSFNYTLPYTDYYGGRRVIIEYKLYNTMKNTRNNVRLTESQLHNVIRESVKKVLSELDWKTYANAARKWSDHLMHNPDDSRRKSNIIGHQNSTSTSDIPTDNRLRGFKDAMINSFNHEFGYNPSTVGSYNDENDDWDARDRDGYFEMAWEPDNIGAQGYYDHLSTETSTQLPKQSPHIPHRMKDEFDLPDTKGNMTREPHRAYDLKGAWDKTRKNMSPTDIKFDDGKYPYMKARNKGNQEIMDYQNGNYEYIKDKGWQLKK